MSDYACRSAFDSGLLARTLAQREAESSSPLHLDCCDPCEDCAELVARRRRSTKRPLGSRESEAVHEVVHDGDGSIAIPTLPVAAEALRRHRAKFESWAKEPPKQRAVVVAEGRRKTRDAILEVARTSLPTAEAVTFENAKGLSLDGKRAVIASYVEQGFVKAEIAVKTGLSAGTVQKHLIALESAGPA